MERLRRGIALRIWAAFPGVLVRKTHLGIHMAAHLVVVRFRGLVPDSNLW
jgi:hypothetical protein